VKQSIHFGLNRVDDEAYNGWPGFLSACRRDADSLAIAAAQCGFSAQGAFDEQVTRELVRKAFRAAAQTLKAGDTLLFNYSGHGYRRDNGIIGGWEEGLCLFDGLMSDVELHNLISLLPAGVDFIAMFDSCHSGGMDRDWSPFAPRYRVAHPRAVSEFYAPEPKAKAELQCNGIMLAACQPNESALDGTKNGVWSSCLLAAFAAARRPVSLTWAEWFGAAQAVCAATPYAQHPLLKPLAGDFARLLNSPITN
jgi:hypothetical protein